jgi:hypothetical protein
MATIGLQAVGTAVGGPVGGWIGAAIGQYVDQAFIFPTLFPEPDVEGPKVDEFTFSGGSEGTPINECYGPKNRLRGTVIWVSPVKQVKIEEESGGSSGAGGQTFVSYEYFVDIAIAWCKSTNPGGAVAVDKILTEGDILYDDTPEFDETSDAIAVSTTGAGRMKLSNTDGTVDFRKMKSGKPADLSDFSNAANNEAGVKVRKTTLDDIGPPLQTSAVLNKTDHVDESAGATATVFQDLPKFQKSAFVDITNYLGTDVQNEDPIILSYEDAERVGAHRGIVYTVVDNLALANFGNRIPASWEGFIRQDASIELDEVVSRLMKRAGFEASEFDVTDLAGISVEGYHTRGPTETTKALQPLMLAFDFVAQEDNGVVRFLQRENATVVEIDADNLAAHQVGGDAPRPSSVTDASGINLPAEVTVSHIDPDKDLQKGAQSQRRRLADSDLTETVDLPITITGDVARSIAARVLWQPWSNQQRQEIKLPPSLLRIQENDLVVVPGFGTTLSTLIERVDFGANGLVEASGLIDNGLVYDVETLTDDPELQSNTVYVPPELDLVIAQIPTMSNAGADFTEPGFYYGAASADPGVQFLGAALRQKIVGQFPPSTTIVAVDEVTVEATIGVCLTALGDGVGPNRWDRTNTVEVELNDGELSSKTQVEVVEGFNRVAISTSSGWEVLAFESATLIATNTYRLSGLIRGMRDTEDAIAGHAIGDLALFLNAPGATFYQVGTQDVGKARSYQAFPSGGDDADFPGFTDVTIASANLVPFRPHFVEASRVLSGGDAGDVVITWIGRTRAFRSPLKGETNPSGEEFITSAGSDEVYSVRLYDPTGSTVESTYEVAGGVDFTAGSPTITLDAADITAAGYSAFDPIVVGIRQRSAKVGFGRERKTTV